MAARKKAPVAKAAPAASVTEWTAAAIGLALTFVVIGYTVWEGVTDDGGPPRLWVTHGITEHTRGGYVVPLVVGNNSSVTAASVKVVGVLVAGAKVVEARRATFTYVPGEGEAQGGLLFQNNPKAYRLVLTAEGYEDP